MAKLKFGVLGLRSLKLRFFERRNSLKTLSFKDKRIKVIVYIEAEPAELLRTVREQNLEGIIGKRKDFM